MAQAQDVLKQVFGHDDFRGGQQPAIDALLSGRDALCVMPTGAGKSVCYQVPALLKSGITLVISPLISLMKDQVAALISAGVPAAYLNSSLTPSQMSTALNRAASGQYKIIYVAPERLQTESFLAFARDAEISLIAVDEAHCVSQWGQDFRPSYTAIPIFIAALPKRPPIGAFTATATLPVRDDIVKLLGLVNPLQLVTGFDRANLKFEVRKPKSKDEELEGIIRQRPEQCGIIYCQTRRAVETVSANLTLKGFPCTRYHAGLSDAERRQNQDDFSFDRVKLIAATNAFGMGIDKSNVSFVVHYNMPKDLESYYQEAGRAGRDGEKADCILLYSGKDVHTAKFLIENSNRSETVDEKLLPALVKRDLERLKLMTYYCTVDRCLRVQILSYFGEKDLEECGNCSHCVPLPRAHKTQPVVLQAFPVDEGLFAHLKEKRLELAKKSGVPAFVIFSDASLRDMASKRPTTLDGFSLIAGVGRVKAERYGFVFVQAIRRYLMDT